MDNQPTTAESPVSRTKEEVVREAKRVEEALLFSSKGHFAAAHFWGRFQYWIGIPMVILSAVAGSTAFSSFDPTHAIAGAMSIIVAVLSAITTFLNPNEKAAIHLSAGNSYDSLMNKVRIFWSIECWHGESDEVLAQRVRDFSEQKDKLNLNCPQIPPWAYNSAKKGIVAGEGRYSVDKK